ncbi:hypothetical protein GJ496_002270 [Pomphorhynchus laevis]|nr:hypothetical protein GJ496_002270 [Pomphorhynchus laevis]
MTTKFGMTLKSKGKTKIVLSANIFDNPSKDDNQANDFGKEESRHKLSRVDQQIIEDAVKEDPLIFEYDEVIDQHRTVVSGICHDNKPRKSKYIQNLLKVTEERQAERERRIERKIQQERQQEGDMYADKEIFVTNAYREKLKAIEIQDQLVKEEEQREAILDVRTQGNLNSFYRYMFKNKLFEDSDENVDKDGKLMHTKKRKLNRDHIRKVHSSDSSDSEPELAKDDPDKTKKIKYNKSDHDNNDAIIDEEKSCSDLESSQTLYDNCHNDSIDVIDQTSKSNSADAAENSTETVKKKINKEEILKKIENRINCMINEFQKKTVGKVFDDCLEEYMVRKRKRLLHQYNQAISQ